MPDSKIGVKRVTQHKWDAKTGKRDITITFDAKELMEYLEDLKDHLENRAPYEEGNDSNKEWGKDIGYLLRQLGFSSIY